MSQERELTVALSAVVSYMIVSRLLSPPAVALIKGIPEAEVSAAFENSANAFVGIISGLVVAYNYKKFSKVKLPDALSFFWWKAFCPNNIDCFNASYFFIITNCLADFFMNVLYHLEK